MRVDGGFRTAPFKSLFDAIYDDLEQNVPQAITDKISELEHAIILRDKYVATSIIGLCFSGMTQVVLSSLCGMPGSGYIVEKLALRLASVAMPTAVAIELDLAERFITSDFHYGLRGYCAGLLGRCRAAELAGTRDQKYAAILDRELEALQKDINIYQLNTTIASLAAVATLPMLFDVNSIMSYLVSLVGLDVLGEFSAASAAMAGTNLVCGMSGFMGACLWNVFRHAEPPHTAQQDSRARVVRTYEV